MPYNITKQCHNEKFYFIIFIEKKYVFLVSDSFEKFLLNYFNKNLCIFIIMKFSEIWKTILSTYDPIDHSQQRNKRKLLLKHESLTSHKVNKACHVDFQSHILTVTAYTK